MILTTGKGGGAFYCGKMCYAKHADSSLYIPICGFCASASKENGMRPPLE